MLTDAGQIRSLFFMLCMSNRFENCTLRLWVIFMVYFVRDLIVALNHNTAKVKLTLDLKLLVIIGRNYSTRMRNRGLVLMTPRLVMAQAVR